jgi:hypothetical protein
MITNYSDNYCCIIGIDPGNQMGVTLLWFHPISMEIIRIEPMTLNQDKLTVDDNHIQYHGIRFAKNMALRDALVNLFRIYWPVAVVSESPFFNRLSPGSYGPLLEMVFSIRLAVSLYDSWMGLDVIPPSNVKQALGAKGNCGKPEMITALINNINITSKLIRPVNELNEHEIDSVAVAYSKYVHFCNTTWKKNLK